MKILFWNLGYARGIDGSLQQYAKYFYRIFAHSRLSQQMTLTSIGKTIQEINPDIFLGAEVSTGSLKNGFFNHHCHLGDFLGYDTRHAQSKYDSKILAQLPFHKGNTNTVLSLEPVLIEAIHLQTGLKTLVYKINTEKYTILFVHLNLRSRQRRKQLEELAEIIKHITGPVILCGDMNIFGGVIELEPLINATGMRLAHETMYTFPSHKPKMALDVCLVRGMSDASIQVTTRQSSMSDHVPVIVEIA